MATSLENKRAGREDELRTKLKDTLQRFEHVFNKPLTTTVLKEFLDESEKWNRLNFLKDRMGVLSDMDVKYLRNILKENVAASTKEVAVDDKALEDISDIDIDDDIEELSA